LERLDGVHSYSALEISRSKNGEDTKEAPKYVKAPFSEIFFITFQEFIETVIQNKTIYMLQSNAVPVTGRGCP
jgi:hypothetical protein